MKFFIPFSNGTEAMYWLSNNCDECYKSKFCNLGSEPADYRCRVYYWLSRGMLSGRIPQYIAKRIGLQNEELKKVCNNFSDTKPIKRKKARPYKLELWEAK